MSAELRDRPVEERDGPDAGRRPAGVRHLPARPRRRLRRGALPDDHAPHALRQDRQALQRDRRLLRPEGLQRRADRPARPLLLRGVGRLLPRRDAAHGARRLRHLRVDRHAAVVERPDRHRRQLLRRDHPGADRARGAAAPDGDLAGRRADEQLPEPVPRGRRDAAAHVLGALHPRAGRAGRARRLEQGRRRCGTTSRTCGSSSGRRRGQRGQTSLRHVPPLEDSLLDYYTRGTYDEYWDRIEHNYTRYWDQHADIPATFSTGWYDPFPAADTRVLRCDDREEQRAPAARVGPWSHVGMRGDATYCHEVDFGLAERLGRAALLRGAARRSSTAGCRTTLPASRWARRRCGSS